MTGLSSVQRLKMRHFQRVVLDHSGEVRFRHSAVGMPDIEGATGEEQVAILVEEVGKLARAINKLRITRDADVRKSWIEERDHRLVTIASVTARIASGNNA